MAGTTTIQRIGDELYRDDGRLLAQWDAERGYWWCTSSIPLALRNYLAAQPHAIDLSTLQAWIDAHWGAWSGGTS